VSFLSTRYVVRVDPKLHKRPSFTPERMGTRITHLRNVIRVIPRANNDYMLYHPEWDSGSMPSVRGSNLLCARGCYLGLNGDENTRDFVFALSEPKSTTRWGDTNTHLAIRAIFINQVRAFQCPFTNASSGLITAQVTTNSLERVSRPGSSSWAKHSPKASDGMHPKHGALRIS